MRTTPDPVIRAETTIHTDAPTTFRRSEQMYAQERAAGLPMGAMHARAAESFRNDKLGRGIVRPSNDVTISQVAVSNSMARPVHPR